MSEKFQRRIENFTCEHCELEVMGNGYTNHCPKCLWSKHVDIYPGDRLATCAGLMRPLRLESLRGEYVVVHQCLACGEERRNKLSTSDNLEALLN